jgi:hypothetical protein
LSASWKCSTKLRSPWPVFLAWPACEFSTLLHII